MTAPDQARRERGRRAPLACSCRICIAKSLARALVRIDRGQNLLAGHIVSLSIIDLARDAVFVTTTTGKAAPLCERDPRIRTARMFRDASIELVEGRE